MISKSANQQISFPLSNIIISLISVYCIPVNALDVSNEFYEPGEYHNVNVTITTPHDIDAISPLPNKNNPDYIQKMILNGKTTVTADGATVFGFRVEETADGYSPQVIANDDVTINIKAKTRAYGIMQQPTYGQGGPDAEPNQGKIQINGALTINAYGECSSGGVVAGSWFGMNGAKHARGTIEFGKAGLINNIKITGGERDSGLADQDKMVGILGYSVDNQQSKITVHGSTNISVITNKTSKPYDVNRGTFGVYAAGNSNITFEDANSTLDIYLASSEKQRRRLDGISSGLYNIMSPGKSSVTVKNNNTNITFGLAENAFGVTSYAHSNVTLDTNLTIKGKDVNSLVGLFASHYVNTSYTNSLTNVGGKINLNGGYNFLLPTDAVVSESRWRAIYVNAYKEDQGKEAHVTVDGTGALSQIHGGIYAVHNGKVDLTIDGANSFLIGHVDQRSNLLDGSQDISTATSGNINLTLKNGATWLNTDYIQYSSSNSTPVFGDGFSTANSVTMAGGTIDMSSAKVDGWQRSAYQKIVLNELKKGSGNNNHGHFVFDMNLAEETNSSETLEHYKQNVDQLIVKNSANGLYTADINFTNSLSAVDPSKMYSENWLISQGLNSDMTVTNIIGGNDFAGRGMVTVWNLVFVPEGQENLLQTEEGRQQLTNNGIGKGNWHLIRGEKWVDPIIPPEIQDNLTIGTSATQALAYQADLEDLRTRLGEVRYGAQDGAWVKVFTKKEQIGSGNNLEQEVDGINVGVDALITENEDAAWLVGGAFRYSSADQKGLAGRHISGELDEYSLKAYATWMQEKGSYADFVLQAGRYEQTIDGLDNTSLDKSHADYNTWGFGASVEVGHMFAFDEGVDDRRWFNHWFIEPQLQLSYFRAKGADYTTATGLKIEQENADFLTGRAGLVIGKKFNYGTENDLDRRYFQIAAIGGLKHEFLGGDQTIHYTGTDKERLSVKANELSGTRYYYGVNADWQLGNQWRVYGQIAREEGDDYTKEYDINLGLKYQF